MNEYIEEEIINYIEEEIINSTSIIPNCAKLIASYIECKENQCNKCALILLELYDEDPSVLYCSCNKKKWCDICEMRVDINKIYLHEEQEHCVNCSQEKISTDNYERPDNNVLCDTCINDAVSNYQH
tara:strand:+ start:3334 stop:3714 length:381 start_codon:yes stop_codon:yes gene_type:complete